MILRSCRSSEREASTKSSRLVFRSCEKIFIHLQAMEFQSLTRRELQSLCKRNKIPANMTNIAMANALKSLEFVEGMTEISQPKVSESAQSSIESPVKAEVTSPYVPPTGGRSTRQRTIAKEEPQTLGPMTRTRGTARKTQAKNKEESRADATETPAAAAQPSRRRVPVASACRKMESQFKECAEEDEKKGVPLTPVALVVTSRRRGLKKESEVTRVYTRRSARLAAKDVEISSEVKNEKPEILRSDLFMKEESENVEMNVKEVSDGVHEVKNEKPEILRSDLFMKEESENVEMNVKEVSDGVHEVSEITGVEVETSLVENFKKMEVTEVSSGQKQDISDENDESNVDEKSSQNSETDDPNLELDQCIDAGDEQLNVHCKTGSELDGVRADEPDPSNGGYVGMALDERNGMNQSNVEEILSQYSETDEPNPEMGPCIDAVVEQSNFQHETGSELNGERADETEPSDGGNEATPMNESNDFVEDGDGIPIPSILLSQYSETDEPNPEMGPCQYAVVEQSNFQHETGSELNEERADETEPSDGGNEATTMNESNDFVEDGDDDDVKQDEVGKENETNPTNEVDNGAKQASEEEPVGDKIAAEELVSESAAIDSPLHLNADFLEINVEERQDHVGDEKESNPIKDTECGVQKPTSRDAQPLGKFQCHEVENLQTEAIEKAAEYDTPSDAVENVPVSIKNSPIKHYGGLESAAATVHSPIHQNADFLKEIKTSGIEAEPGINIPPRFTETDSSVTILLNSLTPTKKSASKASATAKKIADVWDNKENIASCGSKLVHTKERVKLAKQDKDLSALSVRKLSKMLKEKLQITSSKDENGNKVITRPALQALPENRLEKETEC